MGTSATRQCTVSDSYRRARSELPATAFIPVVAPPPTGLERKHRLDTFSYQPLNKKLNWKRLRGLDVDKMVSGACSGESPPSPTVKQWICARRVRVFSFTLTFPGAARRLEDAP